MGIDEEFYNDSSSTLGLNHSPTKADETLRCEKCGARYLTTDAGGHICRPLFASEDNPTLKDERWNEHNNRKLEAEAKAAGEELPEKDVPTGTHTNAGAYRSTEERIKALMEENPGLSLADAVDLARHEEVDAEPESRVKHGEDCDRDCPVCNGVSESDLKREGFKPKGGSSKSGRFKRDKKAKKNGTIGVQIEDEPRSVPRSIRVTESTDYALEEIERETGLNLPALVAAIGNLHDRGDAASMFTLKTIFRAAPGGEDEKAGVA